VRAVLRRTGRQQPTTSAVLRGGAIELDQEAHQVTVDGEIVDLTPTEFDMLEVLMGRPGRAFSRSELLERVMGDAAYVLDRTVDVHIKNLRQKIEPESSSPRYILTVRGVGYKFSEDPDGE
jgi:two-component system response regulator RegX3